MLNAVFGRAIFGRILFGGSPVPSGVIIPIPPDERTYIVPPDCLCEDDVVEFCQTPADIESYAVDWSQRFPGDQILQSSFTCPSSDIIIKATSLQKSTSKALLLVTGGRPCVIYPITNTILLQSGISISGTFALAINPFNARIS